MRQKQLQEQQKSHDAGSADDEDEDKDDESHDDDEEKVDQEEEEDNSGCVQFSPFQWQKMLQDSTAQNSVHSNPLAIVLVLKLCLALLKVCTLHQ